MATTWRKRKTTTRRHKEMQRVKSKRPFEEKFQTYGHEVAILLFAFRGSLQCVRTKLRIVRESE